MSTIGTVKISELNALDTITDGTKLKIPVSNNDSNTSDPDWESYSVNANVLSYFMENSLGLNDVGSEKGLRSQVTDLQSKFDSTLLRNEVGYFSGEVELSEGQTIGVSSRVPTDNSGEFMFCKRINEITKPIYAGFVYRVKESNNTYYYSRGPVEFPYNRPSINGIAINLTDGCAYVVDGNELKKIIPNANALSAGLMTVEDKSKLDNYESTFIENQKATTSSAGLMTSDQVNTLNNALQRVVGYFNGIIDQTIVPEISGTNLKNGTIKFCNSISPILGEKRAGFVYMVNNKYYDIKDVSPDALNALTRPAPFKGGIAINLDDGYAYVVNSTGDMIEKLIDIPESTDISEATPSAAGLMSAKDKSKLDNYESTFTENQKATTSSAGLMTSDQVNTLNKALHYAVGYFDEILILDKGQSIVPELASTIDKSGKVVFCNYIKEFGETKAGFVYRVGTKYYKIKGSIPADALKHPVPFEDGIAIKLSDGCAYVFNSADGTLEKLIDIQEATPSTAGLMTAADKSKLDNYESTFTENQKATTSSAGLMTSDQVNTLNNALQRVVGYFNGITDQTISLEQSGIIDNKYKGGIVLFCNNISLLLGKTRTGFVYNVNGKYYDIKSVSPDILNTLTHPVPFKGGIAINLKDGYVYVVNSTGDKIEKLISGATDGFPGLMTPEILTRLNDIERRLTALESTATTS